MRFKINIKTINFIQKVFLTYNLLFCVLVRTEQVDSLHVSEVNVVAEKKDEQQLAHVLLLLVAIQSLVP